MISAIIIARNEEKNIVEAIKTVSFCDEIIVIDHLSTDQTAKFAKLHKAHVYSFEKSDFSALRNFAMSKAKGEWCLFVDADERITPELKLEIQSTIRSPSSKFESYAIGRIDHFWGKQVKHGEVARASHKGFIRLMKKNSGQWKGVVHEIFSPISSPGKLINPLMHFPHPTVQNFLENINFYSTLRAEELHLQKHTNGVLQIIFLPFLKFLYTYFVLLGFLDGAAGYIYSFMMSFHSFLVQSKLYLLNHQREKPSL